MSAAPDVQWLLVSTFDDVGDARVIGATPQRTRHMVPLAQAVRRRGAAQAMISGLRRLAGDRTLEVLDETAGGRRLVIHPLRTYDGDLHGAWVWLGSDDGDLLTREGAGAWTIDMTDYQTVASDELFDVYGTPRQEREVRRPLADVFPRLTTGPDAGDALAKVVRAAPGTVHQATWLVTRPDGTLRAAHFSCRSHVQRIDGRDHVMLRGITHDVGPAETTATAPPIAILERRILSAETDPVTIGRSSTSPPDGLFSGSVRHQLELTGVAPTTSWFIPTMHRSSRRCWTPLLRGVCSNYGCEEWTANGWTPRSCRDRCCWIRPLLQHSGTSEWPASWPPPRHGRPTPSVSPAGSR